MQITCFAACEINRTQTIKATFELDADAVQIRTDFIGTGESEAIAAYKDKLKEAIDTDTALTRAFFGR